MDMHIAAKHQRPHHTPDLTLLVGDSHMKTINCRAVEAGLGGAKFVCGEHIAAPLTGRRSPRAGKPGRAYNSVGSWPNAKYPESSLDKVVPKLLAQTKSPITTLVVQSPTLDLTNLNHPTLLREPAHRDLVLQSARNVVQTMERALAENPSLRKGVILEQLPRANFSHLSNMAKIYNSTLQQLVAQSPYHRQLVVVGHLALTLTAAANTEAMFGQRSSRRSDGVHFRGPEGARQHTDSVLSALKVAGLDVPVVPSGWSTQGRQGAARLQPSGSYNQGLQTHNMFQSLNH